jgi:hypothetical protein
MDPTLKRIVSSLNNISNQKNESFFIYKNYLVINKQVYIKSADTWIETDEDFSKIYRLAIDLNKNVKKKKVDYLKSIETSFQKYKGSEEIKRESFKIPEDSKEKKNTAVIFYNNCFVGGGEKDLNHFYNLGHLCKKLGENFCINAIYNGKYKNENFSDKKRRTKRSEIQKNLKGSQRFKIFAERLPSGVYQLTNVPLTYFVKITNDEWNEFLCGRTKIVDVSSESDEKENGE